MVSCKCYIYMYMWPFTGNDSLHPNRKPQVSTHIDEVIRRSALRVTPLDHALPQRPVVSPPPQLTIPNSQSERVALALMQHAAKVWQRIA